ncbi:MAG: L-serine ammonia-lyase [Alphaproteobacteria bacterium]
MEISIFELFKIGVGPSSSHTIGPMRASNIFLRELKPEIFDKIARVQIHLYGSLALTGEGHLSDVAAIIGLEGHHPEDVDPQQIPVIIEHVAETKKLNLLNKKRISFNKENDLIFHYDEILPKHSNGICYHIFDEAGTLILKKNFYSIGGGFVIDDEDSCAKKHRVVNDETTLPYPYTTGEELLLFCKESNKPISQIVLENEKIWWKKDEIFDWLENIWTVMHDCIERGCHSTEEYLPGTLHLRRRAPNIYKQLIENSPKKGLSEPLEILDWVNLYAVAVSEENASCGRVVTAPTNGAAGVIPAVLYYYDQLCPESTHDGIINFMLTAGAIGLLYKRNASISGAEVGCQGEIGVACSMAAAGLTEALGGTPMQVENAAEIAMEHNLGLTCDPVGGFVQIPCIERNAMGAVKAINASRIALQGDGTHIISLDQVIETMKKTGEDMQCKYKETSQGGLALITVNEVAC